MMNLDLIISATSSRSTGYLSLKGKMAVFNSLPLIDKEQRTKFIWGAKCAIEDLKEVERLLKKAHIGYIKRV